MRVLVATDSFGDTLTAAEASSAVARGWRAGAPADEIIERPLSDGGPGFVDVLHPVLGGELVEVEATDPLGRRVQARYLRVGDTAYLESASVCGLQLLAPQELDPGHTTSYGLGVLIAAAIESGASRLLVGLGGSGTNDGGAGMMTALGAVPRDVVGLPLPYGGVALVACARLDGTPALRGAEIVAVTDVDNPLLGLHGASAVYGPQKGADRQDVLVLDSALARWAEVLVRDLPGCPADLAFLPGSGAAGGIGAALLASGGRREPGLETVRRLTGLDAALDQADLVVTGEGAFDHQSLRGKVVAGVAVAATERALPCLVVAGRVEVGRRELAAAGVAAAYSLVEHGGSAELALRRPAEVIEGLLARLAREWSRP